jgi:hypothetical protein
VWLLYQLIVSALVARTRRELVSTFAFCLCP